MASGYRTSWLNQYYILTWKTLMVRIREPISMMTWAFNCTFVPALIGLIYWNLGNGQTSINDRMRCFSLIVLLQAFMCFDVVLQFPKERKIYLREQIGGMYS